jgi:hypothetical protein
MWAKLKKFHDYLITFPERLYPFSEVTSEGKLVSGEAAYLALAEKNKALFGDAYDWRSPKLLLWRQLFHFLASVFLVMVAHLMFVHLSFFNGFAFLVLVTIAVAVQEFYLHPHYYGQKMQKGIIDFTAWMLPILLYILF